MVQAPQFKPTSEKVCYDMSLPLIEAIRKLRKDTESSSDAEVIALSVALLEIAVEAEKNSQKIMVGDKEIRIARNRGEEVVSA